MAEQLAETVEVRPVEKRQRAGRRPKDECRADELREKLVKWRYYPPNARPSLRRLAKLLNTSHQLLSHFLVGLEQWERDKNVEYYRAVAKAKNIPLDGAGERNLCSQLCAFRRKAARDDAKWGPKLFRAQTKLAAMYGYSVPLPRPNAAWIDPPEKKSVWNIVRPE